MSVIVTAIATESGVPIFCRKRGNQNNIQFSTIAALHSVNMFNKCHNLLMLDTQIENGKILWKEYCKSITLIGIVTGGMQCQLDQLLSSFYDVMVFYIGKQELEKVKNVDQLKRDLRQCYQMFDYLLEAMDSNTSTKSPTLLLNMTECILCPQAQQLQQVLDNYAEAVSGRWACLTLNGKLIATSSDICDLDPREVGLLQLLMTSQNGAPLREALVYLPCMSPNVPFRAITCKLLTDVYVLVICGVTPTLSQIDEIVLQCWESHAHTIKEAKHIAPRNFPNSVVFDESVLGVLLININDRKCVFSKQMSKSNRGSGSSASHHLDVLRTFYLKNARYIVPELKPAQDDESSNELQGLCETYWCSEYHKCHAQKQNNLLCCVIYGPTVPTHSMRLITSQLLKNIISNKEIYW